jgi:hypothetical protein
MRFPKSILPGHGLKWYKSTISDSRSAGLPERDFRRMQTTRETWIYGIDDSAH